MPKQIPLRIKRLIKIEHREGATFKELAIDFDLSINTIKKILDEN